jgi:hypothetical protein
VSEIYAVREAISNEMMNELFLCLICISRMMETFSESFIGAVFLGHAVSSWSSQSSFESNRFGGLVIAMNDQDRLLTSINLPAEVTEVIEMFGWGWNESGKTSRRHNDLGE